jgi:hypothetical protein
LYAAAGRPDRGLCEVRRAAARRQDDEDGTRYLWRDLELVPKVRDADGRDGHRRRAWTFELADNGHVYCAAIIAIGVDMNMGRGAKDEHQEGDRGNRSDERTVARKSR